MQIKYAGARIDVTDYNFVSLAPQHKVVSSRESNISVPKNRTPENARRATKGVVTNAC